VGSEEAAGVTVIVGAGGRVACGVPAAWRVALERIGISTQNVAGRSTVVVVGEGAGESDGVGATDSDRAAGEWDDALSGDAVVGDTRAAKRPSR
jgi:hypothetical protein